MSPSEPTSSTAASTPFAESMRGQQPQPQDRQFPELLQDLYATANQRREGGAETFAPLANGWSRMDDSALQQAGIDPALLHDAKSGFDAAFYRNDQGQVVLGFAEPTKARTGSTTSARAWASTMRNMHRQSSSAARPNTPSATRW